MSRLLTSWTCILPDLHVDRSLFLSYKAIIPKLYTDIAETVSRTRLRARLTTKLQVITCNNYLPLP
jgi:hypothetical protein